MKISDKEKSAIARKVVMWNNEGRLHAARVFIWNAELDELCRIANEIKSYLPPDGC